MRNEERSISIPYEIEETAPAEQSHRIFNLGVSVRRIIGQPVWLGCVVDKLAVGTRVIEKEQAAHNPNGKSGNIYKNIPFDGGGQIICP